MPKKALAILSSSKTLVDFLWYYTEYGQEFEWDVLIHKNFILSQNYLQKTGIFKNITVVLDYMGQQYSISPAVGNVELRA